MLDTLLAKVVGTQNDRELKRLRPIVAAVNAFEPAIKALSDEQLRGKTAEFRQRVANGEALDDAIAKAIAGRTLEDNLRIIDDNALTAVAVQTVADIERDPHWRARQLTLDVPNGKGMVRMHNVVPRLSETPGDIQWAGGALGQHNHDIFGSELGLSCDEMTALRASGVI